jgi:aryl-alcohol dehydrogenase-like predicted oxidoreductase
VKYVEVPGAKVSAIGLGTWQFGSSEWGYGRDYADRQADAIVARALDLGVTLIDTAEAYGFGRSERIVGRALGERRAEAFVATKLFPIFPVGPIVSQRARASAKRLGVDCIDLYQIHQPNPVVPLGATMPAFAQLMAEGLVRHTGVSNYSLARWQAADRALGSPVLSNQVRYNLVDRRPEAELLPWARDNGRLVIAYSPLAQGLLSARYDADHRPTGLVRRASSAFLPDNLRRAEPLLETLREVAASHDATPAQVALAWLVRRPNVVVIPGASSVAQVESNAAAADLELTDADDDALSDASDAFRPASGPAAWSRLAQDQAGAAIGHAGRRLSALWAGRGPGPGAGPEATAKPTDPS